MTDKSQLSVLAKITEAEFHLAQLDLAKSRSREMELRTLLKSLSDALLARANSPLEEADAALIAGADVNWQAWVEQRRRSINLELAKCLANQETCREVAQRAFGREQAVLSLRKNHVAKQKQATARKADYTS